MCAVMPDSTGTIKFLIVLVETDNGIIEKISIVAGKRVLIDMLGFIPQDHPFWRRGRGCGANWNIPFCKGRASTHVSVPYIFASGSEDLRCNLPDYR